MLTGVVAAETEFVGVLVVLADQVGDTYSVKINNI